MSSGCLAPHTGAGDASFIYYPSYHYAPGQQAEWQGQGEQDKPLPLPPRPGQCQLSSSPNFPLPALAADPCLCFPLRSFPIWPGQRLGLRDPGTLWLDAIVTSDLDLEKRFGSGSPQR